MLVSANNPCELESLAWCEHEDFHPILDPSLTRWKGNEQLTTESIKL
jgi:hypothetical protein